MTVRVSTRHLSVRTAMAVLFTLLAALSRPGSAVGAEPKLELARLPDGDAIVLELQAPGAGQTVSTTVVFVRQTGDNELARVRLLTNVTDPKVTIAVAGAAADESFTIPKKGDAVAVTFIVQGVGTDSTTSGEILADLGDRVVVVAPVAVRARRVTPNVTPNPAATVLGRIAKPGGSTNVSVQLWIQENAGQDLSFPKVALVNFNQKEWGGAGTKDVQGEHGAVTFFPPAPVKLSRRQATPVTVEIDDLEAPGLYEGKVRFSGLNTEPIEVKASVAVRYHWWIALALIALGVMASHFLRKWLMKRRPKLLAQRRLAALRDELDRLLAALEPNPDESKIFASLRTDLRDLFARAGAGEDVKAGTEEIERKLPVLARVVTLRREIEKAGASQLLSQLLPVQLWLRRPGTTAEEQKAQVSALEGIEKSLASEIVDQEKVASLTASSAPPPLKPPAVTIRAEQDLAEELQRGERSVTFVLLVVALVLGFRLLYVNSMTWGQPLDLFEAVLWGLGLHQITSATAFGGIAGLRAQFS